MIQPKPFIKWAGGKSKLIPQFDHLITPKIRSYHEPFLGGGSMFFHLHDRIEGRAFLCDINESLITTYRQVRSNPMALIAALDEMRSQHSPEFYYECRARFNEDNLDSLETAALFIYLNKAGYNGLYRENSKGEFNVPVGKQKHLQFYDRPNLMASAEALAVKYVTLLNQRFEAWAAIASRVITKGDFVYLDPPYHAPSSEFDKYNRRGFSESDQIKVRDAALDLSSKGAIVMVSNSDTEFIRTLYDDRFHVHEIYRSGNISSKGNNRQPVKELLMVAVDNGYRWQ